MAIVEYTMSVNKIKRPIVLTDKDAIYVLLVRLALLEPGTNQAFPTMGLGLRSKYRYSFADNLQALINDYKGQIETYLPSLQLVEITGKVEDKTLLLKVNIDNQIIYPILINTETMTLSDMVS